MRKAIFLIFLLPLIVGCVVANVEPGEGGVKTVKFVGKRGIEEKVYDIGTHFYVPVIRDFVVYRWQARNFPESVAEREEEEEYLLQFKTTDGQNVQCDVSVIYSLEKAKLYRLHDNPGPDYENQLLLPTMLSFSRIELGKYSAEDIYQGAVREEMQEKIKSAMNEFLNPYHIIINEALLQNFAFSPEFEKRVEEKKLAAQQVEINKNYVLAAQEEAKRKEAEAEGGKLAAIKEAEGKAQSQKIAADANRYAKEQDAKGILAIKLSEAEGQKKLAEALGGGQNVVALRFAEELPEKLQIWGVPTGGGDSSSFMDLSGIFGGMFKPTPLPATPPKGK